MRTRILILCALSMMWLSGCSSESSQISSAAGPVPAPASPGKIAGKFYLGANVANASVSVQGLDGAPLGRATTDATGNFFVRGTFPAEFRVTGQVPNGNSTFTCEVRGFQGARFVALNVPNTLVSQYLAAQPGAGLAQAESWAKTQLVLPPNTGLGWIEDGPRAAFSHLAFFSKASAAGGWSAYSAQVVASSQPLGPYKLDFRTLQAATGGLEPGLAALVSAAQRQPRLVASVRAQRKDLALARTVNGEVIAASLVTDAGKWLLGGVGGAVLSDITTNVLGWVTTSLGWNVGTAGSLNEIQQQLEALTTDLNLLAIAGATNNAATELSGYVSSTNTLVTQQGAAVQVATNSNTTNLPNRPSSSTSQLSTLLSSLSGYAATNNLQQFSNYMLGKGGVSNLITLNLKTMLNQDYGIQQQTDSFPVRSSLLLDQTLQTFNYYAGQQSLTANFLVEQAHPPAPIAAPAIALVNAANVVAGSAYDLLLQRQQLPPYPVSDNILVDLQNGLVWYTEVQAPQNWATANTTAANFKVEVSGVTYQNWRLPTLTEMQTLQNRGRYVATSLRDSSAPQNGGDSSYGNYGYVLQGLSGGSSGTQGLGFTGINQINSDGEVWYTLWSYVNSSEWQTTEDQAFRLNHQSDNVKSEKSSTTFPFLMVRSLGPSLLAAGSDTGGAPGPNGTSGPSVMNFYNLDSGEFLGEANPTGIGGLAITSANVSLTLPGLTGNTTVTSVQDFATANVTYTLALGGKFSYGNNGQTSQDNPTATYTQTLPLGGYQGYFSDIQSPIAFNVTSGTANVSVSNYNDLQGVLSWHAPNNSTLSAAVQAVLTGPAGLITGTSTLTRSNPPVVGLTSLLISPRNVLLSNGNVTSNGGLPYYCTGYYSDLSVADLTNRVTWRVANNSTGNTTPSVFFSGTALALNGQPLPSTMGQALFNVTATLSNATLAGGRTGSISDSTYVQIGQPPNQ